MPPAAALALLLLLAATPVAPPDTQGDRIDVGSFTLLVDGQRSGREQFSIVGTGAASDAGLELRAEAAIGDRRSALRLETDTAGLPVRYSLEVRDGSALVLRLGGQRVRGRFATVSRSDRGEAAREYLLQPGMLILDEDGVHQHALLVRSRPGLRAMTAGDTVTFPVLTPSRQQQGTLRLALETETDTVVVSGARLPARRWRATPAQGDERLVWSDARGRILRVVIPARAFEALRDDVPR